MSAAGGPRSSRWGSAIDTQSGADDTSRLVDHADDPADVSGWQRRWIWPALVAAAVIFGSAAGGVDVWRGILIGVGVAIALWAIIASVAAPHTRWHYDVPGARYRATSSWEVAGLAGARQSTESFEQYLRPRLWELAVDLLQARGIDPTSEQARSLIGPKEYDVLTGADTDPRRTTSSTTLLTYAIARLAVDPNGPGRPPVRSPALAGLAGAAAMSPTMRKEPHRD